MKHYLLKEADDTKPDVYIMHLIDEAEDPAVLAARSGRVVVKELQADEIPEDRRWRNCWRLANDGMTLAVDPKEVKKLIVEKLEKEYADEKARLQMQHLLAYIKGDQLESSVTDAQLQAMEAVLEPIKKVDVSTDQHELWHNLVRKLERLYEAIKWQ